ncbi:MAG: winged helix-turn-helix transcriptional regulator [Ruminococcaceae bacterium]|nr:winged helix-turn-helix transcriptional regulator [Oscillospiraceae bacterium]
MHIDLPHDHGNREREELLASMWQDEKFETVAALFKQLADSTRLRIFWILCHSEECVINLSAIMNMSSPAISHHLKLLREAELVVTRREDKEVYYRVADTEKAQTLHRMIESLEQLACPDREQNVQ